MVFFWTPQFSNVHQLRHKQITSFPYEALKVSSLRCDSVLAQHAALEVAMTLRGFRRFAQPQLKKILQKPEQKSFRF